MIDKNPINRSLYKDDSVWKVLVYSKGNNFIDQFVNGVNIKNLNGYLVDIKHVLQADDLLSSLSDNKKVIIHFNTDSLEKSHVLETINKIRSTTSGQDIHIVLWGDNPWNSFEFEYVKNGLVDDIFCNLCMESNQLTHILNTNIRNQIKCLTNNSSNQDLEHEVSSRTNLLEEMNAKLELELVKNEEQNKELELAFKKSSKQYIKFHKISRENELKSTELKEVLHVVQLKNDELSSQNDEISAQHYHIEQQREEIVSQRDMALHHRDTILEQQNEIKDNIAYASRIQYALLPPSDLVAQLLPKHFVLNLPKDVVSGDFYWISQNRQKTVIAVADCTGHGISGAMMSMLGTAFLNEIVNKDNVTNSADVLEQLRLRVIASLHQSVSDSIEYSHDGMDISICVIDIVENTLEYSGANNPLYLFRDGELIEFKPDKMPIGIHDYFEEPFTSEIFNLQSKDTIYMFSDGYPDQFGGEKGKKLKYPNFKKILHNLNDISYNKCSDKLKQEFLDWKGENEQIDDVLILGFEIV